MAAPINEGKILVGAGKLEVKWSGGTFEEVGGTEDGAEFTLSKDWHDVEAAEAPVTLRKELINATGTVSTGLLEGTLDNLLLSWPGEIDPAGTLTIGTDGDTPELELRWTGKAPDGETRVITFERCVSIGDGGHRYTKGANTVINTEFEVLAEWNSGESRWDFGTVVDS